MIIENLVAVMNRILSNPMAWDQTQWHCGTGHCFGGHAQIMSGKEPDDATCKIDAREWLELTIQEADWLFSSYRTLPELHRFVLMSAQGRDRDELGFNRFARDTKGRSSSDFDLNGYDKYGRHISGGQISQITL